MSSQVVVTDIGPGFCRSKCLACGKVWDTREGDREYRHVCDDDPFAEAVK